MDASLCGVLRAFFGNFLSLLSGIKISLPLCGTISMFLADMIDLLLRAWVTCAPRACAPARRRDRGWQVPERSGGGGSPAPLGAAQRAGLHERVLVVNDPRMRQSAEDRGYRPDRRRPAGALLWRARGAEPNRSSTNEQDAYQRT